MFEDRASNSNSGPALEVWRRKRRKQTKDDPLKSQPAHLGPLLLNDVDDVVCKISLNDDFILRRHGGAAGELLGEEPLSLFEFDVCKRVNEGFTSGGYSVKKRQ